MMLPCGLRLALTRRRVCRVLILQRNFCVRMTRSEKRRRAVANTSAIGIVLPSSPAADAEERAERLLGFLRSFDASTFGDGLKALLHAINSGALSTRRVQAAERDCLRLCCEEWTGERWRWARTAAHLHVVLRLHRLLQLSPSPGLRANTRLWLSANCLNLQPAQLFPFFRSLAVLAVIQTPLAEHQAEPVVVREPAPLAEAEAAVVQDGESAEPSLLRRLAKEMDLSHLYVRRGVTPKKPEKPELPPPRPTWPADPRLDMALLSRMACQAYCHFDAASATGLVCFLQEFAHLGIDPARFKPEIGRALLARLTDECAQLSLDEACTVVSAICRLSLKPQTQFWLAFKQHFSDVDAEAAARLLDSFSVHLVRRRCISSEELVSVSDPWVTTLMAGLDQMQLGPLLRLSTAISAHPELGLKQLTQNTTFWPVLLRLTRNVAQFNGDPNGLQMLCRVLAWAPKGLRAQVEVLVEAIAQGLSSEVWALLQKDGIARPPTGGSLDIRSMLRRQLNFARRPDRSPASVRAFFTHEQQLWHPLAASTHSVHDVFRHLAFVATLNLRGEIATPTQQWWSALRQRSPGDPFQPSSDNWTSIVRTVRELLGRPHDGHSYLLPASWYTAVLGLASQLTQAPGANQRSRLSAIDSLFCLLCRQRIQFADEGRLELNEIYAKFCSLRVPDDQFMLMLRYAVKLELPIPPEAWQRLVDKPALLLTKSKGAVEKLLTSAASYWALGLPGAPSAEALRCLVTAARFDHDNPQVPRTWRKFHLLLGDELMPGELLRRLNSGQPELSGLETTTTLEAKSNNNSSNNSHPLEERLKLEYGMESVRVNAVLQDVAGATADYLVTQADGSQRVVMHDAPRLHYWLMPEDTQGGLTLSMRVFIHLVEKAGYCFEMAYSSAEGNVVDTVAAVV